MKLDNQNILHKNYVHFVRNRLRIDLDENIHPVKNRWDKLLDYIYIIFCFINIIRSILMNTKYHYLIQRHFEYWSKPAMFWEMAFFFGVVSNSLVLFIVMYCSAFKPNI